MNNKVSFFKGQIKTSLSLVKIISYLGFALFQIGAILSTIQSPNLRWGDMSTLFVVANALIGFLLLESYIKNLDIAK